MLKKAYSIILAIFIGAFCSSDAFLQSAYTPLINEDEEVLFGFKVEKSEKIVTIAINSGNPDYIVYRFGLKDKIELEFPSDKKDSWKKFTFYSYTRPSHADIYGLAEYRLTFTNGDYTYTIYEEYYSGDKAGDQTVVGIKIINNLNKKEFKLKGDPNSIVGSLIDLRYDERIQIE